MVYMDNTDPTGVITQAIQNKPSGLKGLIQQELQQRAVETFKDMKLGIASTMLNPSKEDGSDHTKE